MNQPTADASKVTLRVKYENSGALYASQALVQVSPEEIFLDFSSGVVADGGEARTMPIHTRIAMTHAGALRLLSALQRTLQAKESAPAAAEPAQKPAV